MDQYIEFVVNHWWLVGIWAAFLIALLWDNNRRNGQTVSTTEATTMINRQDALVLDIRDKADFKAAFSRRLQGLDITLGQAFFHLPLSPGDTLGTHWGHILHKFNNPRHGRDFCSRIFWIPIA